MYSLACIRSLVYTILVSAHWPECDDADRLDNWPGVCAWKAGQQDDADHAPELLATVLRRAFAEWTGPCCTECGLPTLVHGERCEGEDAIARDERRAGA